MDLMFNCLVVFLKQVIWLLSQDQARGAVFEDVPSGVCGSAEKGQNRLSSWTHPQGELPTGAAGGRGADAGGT